MKCMPITSCGRRVLDAIFVIEIDDVLLARMAPGARCCAPYNHVSTHARVHA